MRNFILALSLAFSLGVPSYGAAILNGSFEDGTEAGSAANWTDISANFGWNRCSIANCGTGGGSAGPNTGTYWAWLGGTPSAEFGTLSQTVNIAAGGSATLSAYIYNQLTSGIADDTFTVTIDSTELLSLNGTSPVDEGYVLYTWDISGFADGLDHTIQFQLVMGGTGETYNVHVDDVTLTNTSVPEPASAALCVLGLGAMAAYRRKRVC